MGAVIRGRVARWMPGNDGATVVRDGWTDDIGRPLTVLEEFAGSAFRRDQVLGRPVTWGHDVEQFIGEVIGWDVSQSDGWIHATLGLDDSEAGRRAAVRAEFLDLGLSIAFRSLHSKLDQEAAPAVLVHTAANLGEVALSARSLCAYRQPAEFLARDTASWVQLLRREAGLPPAPPVARRSGDPVIRRRGPDGMLTTAAMGRVLAVK